MTDDAEADPPQLVIPGLPPEEADALRDQPGAKTLSRKEERYLSRDLSEEDMARGSRRNDWGRQEAFRAVFEYLAIGSLVVLFLTMLVIGLVWLWHMLAPPNMRWLNSDQVIVLQDILTGGLVASLIGPHFKRRLERL